MPLDQYQSLIASRKAELEPLVRASVPAGASIVLEVGCGHGHFLTEYAQAHPDVWCVGVDQCVERIERANRKRDRLGLSRAFFFLAEARLFMECLPADVRLGAVFVLFPDPWPKKRHHKNRILQPDFLTSLAGRAGEGCLLYFRTDDRPYFEAAAQVVARHPRWQPAPAGAPWAFEYETVFQARAIAGYQSLVAELSPRPGVRED